MISDDVRRAPEGVRVEMRVPRGRRRLRVAEELADDGEAEARARSDRARANPVDDGRRASVAIGEARA